MAKDLERVNSTRPAVAQDGATAALPRSQPTKDLQSAIRNLQSILVNPLLWLAVAVVLLGLHQYYLNSRANLGGWGVDDAWITFRYSHNLAMGNGPVWNVGEYVEGYTNFLWMAIIALAMKLGFGGIGISIVLGAIAGLVVIPLTFVLAESGPLRGRAALMPALLTTLLAVDGSFATWSIAGLETSFYTMLLTAGLLCVVRMITPSQALPQNWGAEQETISPNPSSDNVQAEVVREERYALAAGGLLVLAALTRPEGLLAYFIGLSFLVLRAIRGRGFGRYLLFYLAPLVVIYLPYFAWRWAYYGWPLPNTFYNKVGSGWTQIERGLNYESKFRAKHSELLFIIPFIALIREKLTYRFSFLLTVVLAYWAYIVYVGGDWDWAIGRFFVPLLPTLIVLNSDGLKSLWFALTHKGDGDDEAAANPANQRRWLFAAVGIIALLVVAQSTYERTSVRGEQSNLSYYQGVAAALYSAAQYIDSNSQPNDLIATTAAGVLPFYSNRPYLDVLGLTDEHIAHVVIPDAGQGRAGHEKEDADYVLGRKPAYIVLTISLAKTDFSKVAGFAENYALISWTADAGYAQAVKIYKRK